MSTRAALTWGRADWGRLKPGEILREAGIDSYRSDLRALVRGLWSAAMDVGQFIASVTDAVERAVMTAWREGAAKAGVAEDELTDAETMARDEFMWAQFSRIPDFAMFVDEHSRENEGTLETCFARADLWINQYNAVVNQAQIMAKADAKLLWVLGPTEEHCRDCARYAGRVYRASTWGRYQIQPQSQSLACHGYRCLCQLEPTDLPANKGRPPAMTG